MSIESSMADYYAQRAAEYERIYQKPERQDDLRRLREFVEHTFAGEHVLEIACGTGYRLLHKFLHVGRVCNPSAPLALR